MGEKERHFLDRSSADAGGDSRRAIAWVLWAFSFLFAGLVGGTVLFALRREIAWLPPVVGFIGYMAAFRKGMLAWNPTIDRVWRASLWLRPPGAASANMAMPGLRDGSLDPDATLPLSLPDAPETGRPGFRVIR